MTPAVQLPCCLQRLWNKCLPHELTLIDNKSQEISKLLESVEPKAVQEIRALAAKLQALNANEAHKVNHLYGTLPTGRSGPWAIWSRNSIR